MAETKNNQNTEGDLVDVLGKFMIIIGVIALFNGKILIKGAKEIKEPAGWGCTIIGGVLMASVFLLLRLERSLLVAVGFQEYIPYGVTETFQILGLLAATFTGLILWVLGLKPFFTHLKYQRAIDSIGLKDGVRAFDWNRSA